MKPANWAWKNHCNCSLTFVTPPDVDGALFWSAVPHAATTTAVASATAAIRNLLICPPSTRCESASQAVAPGHREMFRHERGEVEDQTEDARPDHVGPGAGIGGERRGRGDPRAKTVLEPAEV